MNAFLLLPLCGLIVWAVWEGSQQQEQDSDPLDDYYRRVEKGEA